MLAPAPYHVPAGEDKEESKEAQGGLHSGGTPGNLSREIGTSTSEDGREGKTDIPSPCGASKQGKISLSGGSGPGGDVDTQSLREDRPLAES